ncbi:acetate--CoA ligase family protein [Mycolicibacterium sp. CBMA 226]|uniref:acetate--CoA ligase family protein n=1 Tax=Mycolicibacterium sp. CBMA 226 TaxID=2606611 RepID=UPI001316E7D2|nr:acetate--CoA ligase family protein [Mycolicibacterium sp. CBMA 226]QGW61357.1 hypothetical protein ICEMyc226_00325 [Mycolicibacterium sp.]
MYSVEAARNGINSILRPKSIAVIGASAKRAASGNGVLANLRRYDFSGNLYAVHPSAGEIDGIPAVPEIPLLPNDLDVALVSLPARAVVPTLYELAAAGCRSAVVPTVGMSPTELDELRTFVRNESLVVHGPNCMGVLNYSDAIPLWMFAGGMIPERPGNISLVSQSGSGFFMTRGLERARMSKIISTGSEIGLTAENYLHWLAQDSDTAGVGLILESLKDVPAFIEAVAELRRAGKPLVTLKVGRTEAGAAATTAHTGALVGRDDAYAKLFERLDIPLVADYDEMAAALELFSWRAQPGGKGTAGIRVAALTISGGQAGLAADLATASGVSLPTLSAETALEVQRLLPVEHVNNPLDTGDEHYEDKAFGDAVIAVANDPSVDSVLVVLDAQSTLAPVEFDFETRFYPELNRAAAAVPIPIVVASTSAASTHPEYRELAASIPLLRGIGNGFVALRALAGNSSPVPLPEARPAWAPSAATVAELRDDVSRRRGSLDSGTLSRLIDAYGLPFVSSVVVEEPTEAVARARDRYPVVAKISSPDITHRSDIGAVVTDIHDAESLTAALTTIADRVRSSHPNARIAGFELQEQVPPGIEALIGFVSDPVFGATVTVGMGGTLVELIGDAEVAHTPLSEPEAAAMIQRTRLGRLLNGYRNLNPPTDITQLTDTLVRVSWLAADFADLLAGGDFNPAIVEIESGRVRLVDALVERAAVPTHKGPQ